jgi:hypothetical protein
MRLDFGLRAQLRLGIMMASDLIILCGAAAGEGGEINPYRISHK